MSPMRCLLSACLLPAFLWAQDDPAALLQQLLMQKDDCDVAVVEKIAAARTREAAAGLVKAYDGLSTLLLRREVVRAMAHFVGVADAEQPALDKVAAIATGSEEEELRLAAIEVLGRSPTIGKALLRKIVEAEAPDALREPALVAHARLATADDAAFYRFLWNVEMKQRKNAKGDIAAPELNSVRLIAFKALLPFAGEAELVDGLKRETDPKIRRAALAWLHKQSMPRAAEMAEWVLGREDFPGADRAEAARILVDRERAKAVPKLLALAKKPDAQTPADLRAALAALIGDLADEATDKKLVKAIGKGKPHEREFALLAAGRAVDDKGLAAVRKELAAEALEVRRAAARVLGERRDRDSLPVLQAMLDKPKFVEDGRLAIETMTRIHGGSSTWLKQLAVHTRAEDREVRNAAVEALGAARDKRQLEALLVALEHVDWSTRLQAIDALAQFADKPVVAKFVERIGLEQGRLQKRLGEVLWQLTAQPFETDAAKWQAWWAQAGEKFTVVTEKELDQAAAARERRRLTQRTVAQSKFFGIKVESQRVIFVLDVSGSMLESMYGRTVGKRPASRIDVAKEELALAIKNLEAGALFNVLTFSNGVARWQKEGIGVNTQQSRNEALAWVERLGAAGGTNLYDAVKEAFADKDVDTIFVLSDGEPTAGEQIDPYRIREDIAAWNRHRRVKIHTIAVGGSLEVLEWLALDSGGRYLQMR